MTTAKTIFIQAFSHENISIDVCIESCPDFTIIRKAGSKASTHPLPLS
jgi:hypothetical protein